MTKREAYAEAAEWLEYASSLAKNRKVPRRCDALAARVLRALADGAVLCKEREYGLSPTAYYPLDPQP